MNVKDYRQWSAAPIRFLDLWRRQWQSPERLRALQSRRLRRIVQHAYLHTEFYRERFSTAGVTPEDIRSPADLSRLPVLMREDLRSPEALLDRRRDPAGLVSDTTSGSTGRRTTVHFDPGGHFLAKTLIKARARLACGVRPWHRIALVQEQAYGRRSATRGRVRSFSVHEPLERLQSQLAAFVPDVIYGFPGHLALLGEAADGTLRPRLVFTSGELLDGHLRRRLETAFAAPVLDVYGCTEVKEMAFQCVAQHASGSDGYHLNADWLVLEALPPDDPSGLPQGSLVVTSLYNRGMPLIRYAMGDMGELLDGMCPCGRGLPLVRPTAGRLADYFCVPDGHRIAPYSMTCAIEAVPGMRQYQIVQTAADRVEVRVVPNAGFDRTSTNEIRRRLAGILPGVAVSVKTYETLSPGPAGKFRVVHAEWHRS